MTSAEKARATRERNQEAQTALYQEKAAANQAARLALQRVFEAPDATPEQVLTAAKLLTELGKW